ncbi:MAG TPA: cation:proton antiporter [Euzebya sp.]|nr:cation:proton antiporter [Euzebya sp.]
MPDLLEFDPYVLFVLVAGLAALGAAVLPRLLAEQPLSYPIVYVVVGATLFRFVPGLVPPDLFSHGEVVEHLTELGVIVSLMGAGLKIDRRIGWRSWSSTWRLLAITMPLSIIAVALLGWWVVGFAPASALLLGAVLAPTDPVLASDVQVGPPGEGEEHDVRFALTSEAGLNDALAFPFTNAAIAMAAAGGGVAWVGEWVAVDVVYRLAIGFVVGVAVGRLVGHLAFSRRTQTRLAEHSEGFIALAATLVSYGAAEMVEGYGFLAVFVTACTLRSVERDDRYHEVLHDFAEQTERLLAVGLLVGFGAALAGGVLRVLTPSMVLLALLLIAVVRPATGLVALTRSPLRRGERIAVSFFGIRGIGSIYYLAHAMQEQDFQGANALWALVALVIMISVIVHGAVATPVMRRIEQTSGHRARTPTAG